MRIVATVAICSALISSCDTSAKTFGKSYDECLLKNASLEQSSASEICARHFERLRTFEERDSGLLTTTATLDNSSAVPQIVRVTVTNNSRRVIASDYEVNVVFWSSPDTFTTATFIEASKLRFFRHLRPGESAEFVIPIESGLAPSQHFTADALIWKVVPLQGND